MPRDPSKASHDQCRMESAARSQTAGRSATFMVASLDLVQKSIAGPGPAHKSRAPVCEPVDNLAGTAAARAILRDCFEFYHTSAIGLAKLSIETSNDLFEMDPLVTMELIYKFKSKRKDWVEKFDAPMR